MKIKQSFYDTFCCIAGQCPLTCCMQWKIAVDGRTKDDWRTKTFEGKPLSSYLSKKDGSDVICLNGRKFCPFLDEERLCSLVHLYGENVLSETCHTFPRQVHDFGTVQEYSLVSCCPAVIDLMDKQDIGSFLEKEGQRKEEPLFAVRTLLMNFIANERYSVATALLMGYFILSDLYERCGDEEIQEQNLTRYFSRQFQEELYTAVEEREDIFLESLNERGELWLDIVENYRREGLYTEYIEEISRTVQPEKSDEQYRKFLGELEAFMPLLRKFLLSELFTNLLIPDGDLLSMVVKMQWISMEYAAVCHGIYLKWRSQGTALLDYKMVKEYMVIVSRMMGYDEEDIYEYMENSFECLVWEWGYMAFMLGK